MSIYASKYVIHTTYLCIFMYMRYEGNMERFDPSERSTVSIVKNLFLQFYN